MRYPPTHRDDTRRRIIESARKLFNRFGFDKVSIEQIMAEAGLTRSGFYLHFDSKSDLYAEALSCFFTNPERGSTWKGISIDLTSTEVGPQIVHAYLSREHVDEIDNPCPIVALPSDVARAGEKAKRAFETTFKAMVDILQRDVQVNEHDPRRTALAIAALCVGGMVIARASHDRTLTDDLREAAIAVALKLGGWDEGAARKPKISRRYRSAKSPV